VVYQIAGVLYDRVGTQAYYAMAVLTAVGLLAATALTRRWRSGLLIQDMEHTTRRQ